MSNTYDAGRHGAGGHRQVGHADRTRAATIDLAQDFSYTGRRLFGSIGNLVWQDLNADGIYEPALGETAIAGVTLDLYRDLNGDGTVDPGEPRIGTQTTDGSGLYLFSGCRSWAAATPMRGRSTWST